MSNPSLGLGCTVLRSESREADDPTYRLGLMQVHFVVCTDCKGDPQLRRVIREQIRQSFYKSIQEEKTEPAAVGTSIQTNNNF